MGFVLLKANFRNNFLFFSPFSSVFVAYFNTVALYDVCGRWQVAGGRCTDCCVEFCASVPENKEELKFVCRKRLQVNIFTLLPY
jgi:hypothetical protein